eukprot:925781-Rhodomonas_salina.1
MTQTGWMLTRNDFGDDEKARMAFDGRRFAVQSQSHSDVGHRAVTASAEEQTQRRSSIKT